MGINLSGRALKRLRLPVVNYYSSACQVVSAQAGDVNTRYIDVVLYDDRGDIDLSAYSKVYLQANPSDGSTPQMSEGEIDVKRNRAVCHLTSSMLSYSGTKMPCNVWFVGTDDNGQPMSLTSQTFYVMVYESQGGADIDPGEDEMTALQSAINDVINLEKEMKEAELNRQNNFKSVYIKYSFYSDGTDFTDSWQDGQLYMGISNSSEEPDNADGYSWIPLSVTGGSSDGTGSPVKPGEPGKDGFSIYRLYGDYTPESVEVDVDDIGFLGSRNVQPGDMLLATNGLLFILTKYENDGDDLGMEFYADMGGDVDDDKIQEAVNKYLSDNEINVELELEQESGDSETSAMSQKAVTQLASSLDERIKAIEDSMYTAISVTSFNTSPANFEVGSTVSSLTLHWKVNKTPKTLTLTTSYPSGVETIDVTSTSKSVTGLSAKHNSNVTWTLEAIDERGATSKKSTSVAFLNGVYYGASSIPTEYNSAFVLGLSKELRGSKKSSFSADAGNGEYIFYCQPVRLGTCAFSVGGFTGGFTLEKTISFTNAFGYAEDYYIYRSDNANLGVTSVSVS